MNGFSSFGLKVPHILLPHAGVDLQKWAVVACDQFTSQPEYWREAASFVGDAPSALNMIYPEAWLSQGDGRIETINSTMADYAKTVLTRPVNGFEIVWRETPSGTRLGLMAEIDLEKYDPMPGSASLIRATEATVPERIPPRVRIREHASLESPHAILLVDDPLRSLVEPLAEKLKDAPILYDTPLMLGGGHIRAARVPEADHAAMFSALESLLAASRGLLFAVGDGNHSLATARACWLKLKETLPPVRRETHPARWALVEIENIYDSALRFEPIHRVLFGVDEKDLAASFSAWLTRRGMRLAAGGPCVLVADGSETPFRVENDPNPLPLFHIQLFLDEYLSSHPGAEIDYVHGDDAVRALTRNGRIGLLLPGMDKSSLFEAVRVGGSLPRKTFSMGSAREKRYYMECRSLAAEV